MLIVSFYTILDYVGSLISYYIRFFWDSLAHIISASWDSLSPHLHMISRTVLVRTFDYGDSHSHLFIDHAYQFLYDDQCFDIFIS